MASFKKRLKAAQGYWDAGKDKGFSAFPEGLFKFKLQDARVTESKSTDKLMAHLEHLCIEGEAAGEVKHDFFRLEDSEWGPTFLMQMIESLGREVPARVEDVEEVLEELAKAAPVYMARVKTNKDGFSNLNVTRLLEDEGGDEEAPPEDDGDSGGDDDDEDEAGDDDDEDEDKDEDEEPPKPKSKGKDKGKAAKKAKKGKKAKPGSDDDENDEDDEDSMLDDVRNLAQTLDVKVKDSDGITAIVKKINAFEWDRSEFMPDEVALMDKIGAKFAGKKPRKHTERGEAPKAKAKAKKGKVKKGKGRKGKGRK